MCGFTNYHDSELYKYKCKRQIQIQYMFSNMNIHLAAVTELLVMRRQWGSTNGDPSSGSASKQHKTKTNGERTFVAVGNQKSSTNTNTNTKYIKTQMQIHKYEYTNANTQMQIHKYTNTQIHKYKSHALRCCSWLPKKAAQMGNGGNARDKWMHPISSSPWQTGSSLNLAAMWYNI